MILLFASSNRISPSNTKVKISLLYPLHIFLNRLHTAIYLWWFVLDFCIALILFVCFLSVLNTKRVCHKLFLFGSRNAYHMCFYVKRFSKPLLHWWLLESPAEPLHALRTDCTFALSCLHWRNNLVLGRYFFFRLSLKVILVICLPGKSSVEVKFFVDKVIYLVISWVLFLLLLYYI